MQNRSLPLLPAIVFLVLSVLYVWIPATTCQVMSSSATHDVYAGQSIQEAINLAQPWDIIFVHNGTYYGGVEVNKTVSLVGESRENTVIDNGGFHVDADNVTISGFTVKNGGGISFSGGQNLTISQNIIRNCTEGVNLYQVYDVMIENNIISSSGHVSGSITFGGSGIWVWNCFNIIIEDNEVRDNIVEGIATKLSGAVTIDRNVLANNSVGIRLTSAYYDTAHEVSFNTMSNHTSYGILLDQCYSGHVDIEGNTVADNEEGIYLKWSSGHTIYHNNFVNNTKSASVYMPDVYSSKWDSGYPSGGNYWSDYEGTDADHDGIGEASYTIDLNNTDQYPLTGIFQDFTVHSYPMGTQQPVEVVSNSTVTDLYLYMWMSSPYNGLEPGQPFLQFSATGEDGSVGFCRLMIPKTVLNGSTYIVLVDSNPINATLLPFSNSTHAYLYFTYGHSTHEVWVTIPEFSSILVLSLLMIATLFAIVVPKRKRFQHQTGRQHMS